MIVAIGDESLELVASLGRLMIGHIGSRSIQRGQVRELAGAGVRDAIESVLGSLVVLVVQGNERVVEMIGGGTDPDASDRRS